MNVKEVNGRLTGQPYVSGFHPSKDDAALFTEMFGTNNTVVQWAAQMASYYQSERADFLKGTAAAKPAPKAAAAAAAAKKPANDDDDDVVQPGHVEELRIYLNHQVPGAVSDHEEALRVELDFQVATSGAVPAAGE